VSLSDRAYRASEDRLRLANHRLGVGGETPVGLTVAELQKREGCRRLRKRTDIDMNGTQERTMNVGESLPSSRLA